jgi:hypothetical protein
VKLFGRVDITGKEQRIGFFFFWRTDRFHVTRNLRAARLK